MPTCSRFTVQTTPDDIAILYDGKEVLYWTFTEWEEDPSVVINIVTAVTEALTRPGNLYKFLRDKGLI